MNNKRAAKVVNILFRAKGGACTYIYEFLRKSYYHQLSHHSTFNALTFFEFFAQYESVALFIASRHTFTLYKEENHFKASKIFVTHVS